MKYSEAEGILKFSWGQIHLQIFDNVAHKEGKELDLTVADGILGEIRGWISAANSASCGLGGRIWGPTVQLNRILKGQFEVAASIGLRGR